MEDAEAKQEALRELLRASAPLVIAYSGGVDSAYLLAVASEVLGKHCLGVIADSPSLPRKALTNALQLAHNLGARVEVVRTDEMQNPDYAANPINRCYFCKSELFAKLDSLARGRGLRSIAYGENADDAFQVRPGREAAAEFQVRAPLREVGLTKNEIRALSRAMNLPTADVPAQPCLSSRIPHGTPVTREALEMIERAEDAVRRLGFRVFRVRHHSEAEGCFARIEVAPGEQCQLERDAEAVCAAVRAAGYAEVSIDPRGYRTAGG